MSNQSSEPAKQSPPKELNSLQEAIEYAIQLHQKNELNGAEALYKKILELSPDQPDALHFLGMIRYQRGRPDEAISLIMQAIKQSPDHPDLYSNLGNILMVVDNADAALACYKSALELAPEKAGFHNNLGVLNRLTEQGESAEAEFNRAIELDPKHFRAYNNLGLLYESRGDTKAAIKYFCTSVTLRPQHPDGHKLLGIAYYMIGKLDEATEVYRKWLEQQPDNPLARHYYAACSGIDVPVRADDKYIEQTFDNFAGNFEEQLNNRLSYKAPELIVAALRKHLPQAAKQFDILDAGCGTGLCGPLIAAYAKQLTGVDLSAGMLQKAEGKECYDKLIKRELTAFLNAPEQAASWDVILSADTLCYFGPLERVIVAAQSALREGGLIVFSVEDGGERALPIGHVLNPHGRYAHHVNYVRKCLQDAGFAVLGVEHVTLRTEGGNPVLGLVVVGQAR
jgi:predicted TPR repeat methyltransferase